MKLLLKTKQFQRPTQFRVCPKFLVRRSLNQDLQDLEIFGIAGERVMAVKGIFFRRLNGQIAEGQ